MSFKLKNKIKLINILLKLNIALDASDTGTGKTYMATATCLELDKIPFIICPKILIHGWKQVLAYFGCDYYDIVNYETIRNGKTYRNNGVKTRKHSEYLRIIDPENALDNPYKWDLPKNAIVIFDEVHRCKDADTDNGVLLASVMQLIDSNIPVLLLSATICEKIADIKLLFYLFRLIPNPRNFTHYMKTLRNRYPQYFINQNQQQNNIQQQQNNMHNRNNIAQPVDIYQEQRNRDNRIAKIIYQEIKEFTARIRIQDLGSQFPRNHICGKMFDCEKAQKISQAYEKIIEYHKLLRENNGYYYLTKIQKLRQAIEFYKIPIFIEQARSHLEQHKSVIIFVNYLQTLRLLSDELSIECKIYGDQSVEARQLSIDKFQSNQTNIIICQTQAGGVGISLHDLHGGHPRVVLISCPDSASKLLQALGRAARSNAKTTVLQRILFVANVEYEKKMMEDINRKLSNISLINDYDVNGNVFRIHDANEK